MVGHQDHDVVGIARQVIADVADEVEALEHGDIVGFQPFRFGSGLLAAIDDAVDGAVEEAAHRVVEAVEWSEGALILLLDGDGCLLETREHGALTASEVLARVAVLADFVEDFLQQKELIGDEWVVCREGFFRGEALEVRGGVLEHEEIVERGAVLLERLGKDALGFIILGEDAALDDFVDRRRGEGEARLEARHDAGELVLTDLDDLVERFLARRHDPDLAVAFGAEFLGQGLEVQQHVGVGADVLPDFIGHEEQTVVVGLALDVCLDFLDELRDADLGLLGAVEPVTCRLLTHAEDALEDFNDVVLKEAEDVARLLPACAMDLLEYLLEFLPFALLTDELLQSGCLEVFAVEAEVVVEHLREDAQDSCLRLVARSFYVDVEEDGVCMACRSLLDLLLELWIIGYFCEEALRGVDAADFLVLQ